MKARRAISGLFLFLLLSSFFIYEVSSQDGGSFSEAITVFDSREGKKSGGIYSEVSYRDNIYFKFYVKKWETVTVILAPEEDDQDLFLYDTDREIMDCGFEACTSTYSGTRWEFLRVLCIESGYYYARVHGYHSGHFALIVSNSITAGMLEQIIQNVDHGFAEASREACVAIPDLVIQFYGPPGAPSLLGTCFDYPIFIESNGYPDERSIGDDEDRYYYFYASYGEWIEIKLETLWGDADLYIYDENRNLIERSLNSGTRTDRCTIVANKTGKYYIVVEGYVRSRYSLSCTKS